MTPKPQRDRWQPLRGGLLNLYRYDHEEFHYEDGHLLLRGNNGTGKSRVLALQLPFLFDGEVAPYRMEPDGDPAKKVEWNLLLGKPGQERTGYTWLELGRRSDDGTVEYLTLGCGLHAVSGRGLTDKWFFITEQRVGHDLALESQGYVFRRGPLAEAIGAAGEIFTTASSYRAAVDRRLFHLGPDRYEALISLLIQLRQPQLSRKLDENKLSQALSEALPPLGSSLIEDVAEAFRGLEDDRLAVERLEAANKSVEEFLRTYRRYTQIAGRRRADDVRGAHGAYESTMRRLRAAEAELEAKSHALAEITARLAALELEEQEADTAVRTLESSPEMRDKKSLDDARRLADERRADAESAARDLDAATRRREERENAARAAEAEASTAWENAQAELDKARDAAEIVGLDRDHGTVVEALGLPGETSAADLAKSSERLQATANQRRQAARLVAELNQALATAEAELTHAKTRHTEATTELDEGLERLRAAQDHLTTALDALRDAYRAWHRDLRELAPPAPTELVERLDEWARTLTGTNPIVPAVRNAATAAFERLASERAALAGRRNEAAAALDALRAEDEELTRGVHAPPPLPHTRSQEQRQSRDGAPLWLLCDFAPGVAEKERAGLEAALEAAGLLDAWVTPDGRLLEAGDHDAVLVPGEESDRSDNDSLDRLLRPAAERLDPRAAAVADEVVEGVLRRIGVGDGTAWAWVDTGGRWQLGPLRGTWQKPAAQHLGESAREAERQRRLAVLRREIREAEAVLDELDSELERHGERESRARREADEAPAPDGVQRALVDIDAANAGVERRRERLRRAEERVAEERHRVDAARDERDTTARDLGLADWVERLGVLDDALGVYLGRLGRLWSALHTHVAARVRATEAAERSAEAEGEASRRGELHQLAEQRARRAATRRDTLEASVGVAVSEILARLEAARVRSRETREAVKVASKEQNGLEVECAVGKKDIERESDNLERDAFERDDAVESLRRYVLSRLLSVALARLESGDPHQWSASRAVEVARRIEEQLAHVESGDPAWERNQRDILRHFQTLNERLLEHEYQPFSTMEDDLFVVTIPFQGRDCTTAELRDNLIAELQQHQTILNAREREVIENHLIGEVATHLHERLRAAEEWVREMNDELESRPMSTGMKLRFVWEPVRDGPAGLAEARRYLLKADGIWSPDERRALGDFLHEQIQAERLSSEKPWKEQMTLALDYRAWHRFSVERHQDGQWRTLTRRTHGTGSGGEKAIALTIPQFAAAAAHYRTADPRAPRLILLDEAFVGVDADMRAKCMGLLHAFDLDFVMTSEREWGCYATLPGVAIYHLSTRPGIDAVGLTRWVWNGRERVMAPHDEAVIARP